jgi:outer membrane protein assembly factor BamE (lipoprotein component of BamABCDE complex)
MNFLKKLFSGGGGGATEDRGRYFYVQPKMCPEVVRVRVDPMNDLSQADDGDGYYVRKMASGHRCPFQAELEIYFDKNRRVVNTDVTNGKLVDEAAWLAQQPEDASV